MKFSSQIISNVPTGASPLVVASTTKVVNFNADLLDGYDSAIASTANTVAVRNNSGYLSAVYFLDTNTDPNLTTTNTITGIYASKGDTVLYRWDAASVKVFLGLSSGIVGTLTSGAIPVAIGINAIADSVITQSGGIVSVAGGFVVNNNAITQDGLRPIFTLQQSGVNKLLLGISAGISDIITGDAIGDVDFRTNAQAFNFSVNNGSSITFKLASSGAATFVSTATATSFINSASSDLFFLLGGGGTVAVADFVTAEREINTGVGLSGGGDLTANRTIVLDHLGFQDLVDPNADRIAFWDDSAGKFEWLDLGGSLSISGTTLSISGSFINNHSGTYVEQSGGYWTNGYNITSAGTGEYVNNTPFAKLIVNPFHLSGALQDFASNPYPVDVQIGAFESSSTVFDSTQAASLFIGMKSEDGSVNKHGLFISEPESGDGHYSILVKDYTNTDVLFSLIGGIGRFSSDVFANQFWVEGGNVRMSPSSGTGGEVLIQSDLGNLGTDALVFTLTAGSLEMTSTQAYMYLNNRTTDPDAPTTGVVLFRKIVSSKTRLYARFPTGAIQQIALEP